ILRETRQASFDAQWPTNFPEIVFNNLRSWSPINDKLSCILIHHGQNRGITAPKPLNNHWFSK
ncbi:zinc finger MYM-type protein 5-like, partial [Aphis craccivora]